MDLIALGGDLVNFPSPESVDDVLQELAKLPGLYVVLVSAVRLGWDTSEEIWEKKGLSSCSEIHSVPLINFFLFFCESRDCSAC